MRSRLFFVLVLLFPAAGCARAASPVRSPFDAERPEMSVVAPRRPPAASTASPAASSELTLEVTAELARMRASIAEGSQTAPALEVSPSDAELPVDFGAR